MGGGTALRRVQIEYAVRMGRVMSHATRVDMLGKVAEAGPDGITSSALAFAVGMSQGLTNYHLGELVKEDALAGWSVGGKRGKHYRLTDFGKDVLAQVLALPVASD